MRLENKSDFRKRRHFRVRRKIRGSAECPRMCVFRSNKHIYVQIVDDDQAVTLAQASTMNKELKSDKALSVETARQVGQLAAQRARAKGVETVVFDRGGFRYSGRIEALANAAREEGLIF